MADQAWTDRLSQAMANALDELRPRLVDRVELLAVDCHPWNGFLDLALLTRSEAARVPSLRAPAEMAAWAHFHFGSALAAWRPASALARRMREDYDRATRDRAGVADGYLRACAAALASRPVQDAIARYDLSDDFRLSVPHPDADDFYPPA